jgi:hypothetical protein
MWQPLSCFGSLLEVDDYSAKAHSNAPISAFAFLAPSMR